MKLNSVITILAAPVFLFSCVSTKKFKASQNELAFFGFPEKPPDDASKEKMLWWRRIVSAERIVPKLEKNVIPTWPCA